MRASPVDFIAGVTAIEAVIVTSRQRFKLIGNLALLHWHDHAIACQAVFEGGDPGREIKALDDLEDLLIGIMRPYPVGMGDDLLVQQKSVTSQPKEK